MFSNYELRKYDGGERIWAGKYLALRNLPHWHMDCELVYADNGGVCVSVNDKSFQLSTGEAVFIESGALHHIESEPQSVVTVLLFDSSLTRGITDNNSLSSPLLSHSYDIKSLFYGIHSELRDKLPLYSLKAEQLLISLLIDIFRNEELKDAPNVEKPGAVARFKNVFAEIEQNCEYMDFSSAAALVGLNKSYFSRCFKKIAGMSFSSYLNTVRVERAIELLRAENGISISKIASRCGFETQRHFNRVFREITGFAPSRLPKGYELQSRPASVGSNAFDPTEESSVLLN